MPGPLCGPGADRCNAHLQVCLSATLCQPRFLQACCDGWFPLLTQSVPVCLGHPPAYEALALGAASRAEPRP